MNNVCTDEHEGTSCGATSDCGGQLRCIAGICRSGIPSNGVPVRAQPQVSTFSAPPVASNEPSPWLTFRPEGVHGFLGFTLRGGPAREWVVLQPSSGSSHDAWDPSFRSALLFGIRGGVWIDQHELALEISPMTFDYYKAPGTSLQAPGSTFQMTASYAYFATLHESSTFAIYWPLRIGAGFFTGNTYDQVYAQFRADLIGVAFRFGHLIAELHLPSVRYASTTFEATSSHVKFSDNYLYFDSGISLSYIF